MSVIWGNQKDEKWGEGDCHTSPPLDRILFCETSTTQYFILLVYMVGIEYIYYIYYIYYYTSF